MADVPPAEAALDRSGRDASRSPMQWDATPGGGFSPAKPWLALGDTEARNVADQRDDPGSLLSLYRRVIRLRNESKAIGLGSQRTIDLPAETPALAFLRTAGPERVLVVVNVSGSPLELDLFAAARGRLPARARLRISTSGERGNGVDVDLEALELDPAEGLVIDVPSQARAAREVRHTSPLGGGVDR